MEDKDQKIAILKEQVEKLRGLILFTDKAMERQVITPDAHVQWAEYKKWMKEKGYELE